MPGEEFLWLGTGDAFGGVEGKGILADNGQAQLDAPAALGAMHDDLRSAVPGDAFAAGA